MTILGAGVPNEAVWEVNRQELAAFRKEHKNCESRTAGTCCCCSGWPHSRKGPDGKLGRWVGSQRVFKKQLDKGPPFPYRGMCKISARRVAKLNADGFLWEIGSGTGMYERANFREAASKMTSQVHDAGGAAAAPRVAKRDLRACAPPQSDDNGQSGVLRGLITARDSAGQLPVTIAEGADKKSGGRRTVIPRKRVKKYMLDSSGDPIHRTCPFKENPEQKVESAHLYGQGHSATGLDASANQQMMYDKV